MKIACEYHSHRHFSGFVFSVLFLPFLAGACLQAAVVFPDMVVQSGAWLDPSIWMDETPPDGESMTILNRFDVTLFSGDEAKTGLLLVGETSNATVSLQNATLTTGLTSLGVSANVSGQAHLNGGTWTNSGPLTIGEAGSGSLVLTNQGTLTAPSVVLAVENGSNGELRFGTGGEPGTILTDSITTGSGSAVVNFDHSSSLALNSTLKGNLSVNQSGLGITILAQDCSYTGATVISSGTLLIAGNCSSSPLDIREGATVGTGSDSILSSVLSTGGFLCPGGSGERNSIGSLTVTQNLQLCNSAVLSMELGGHTAGTLYDQISCSTGATITLSQAQLHLSFVNSFQPTNFLAPQEPERFFIVVGSTTPITGTFSNFADSHPDLPGFSTTTINGQTWAISYTGQWNKGVNSSLTGGNDIVVFAIPEPKLGSLLASAIFAAFFFTSRWSVSARCRRFSSISYPMSGQRDVTPQGMNWHSRP